jgi:hypothetical protein
MLRQIVALWSKLVYRCRIERGGRRSGGFGLGVWRSSTLITSVMIANLEVDAYRWLKLGV